MFKSTVSGVFNARAIRLTLVQNTSINSQRLIHTTAPLFYAPTYDGTAASISEPDKSSKALATDLPTVSLSFDKHSPKSPTSNNPIVFLHGLFGSKANNRSVSKQISKRLDRDVYCLDLRNHGDSPHAEIHEYPSLAADVERFIEDQGLIDPVIIGHSMGAKTAMAVCLRRPELCSLLISVDNAPVDFSGGGGSTGFSKFGKYVRSLKDIVLKKDELKSMKDCDAVLANVEDQIGVRQFLLTNIKPSKDGNGYYSRVPLDVIGKSLDNISAWPFDPKVSRWSKPSLFIRGSKSPYIADEYLRSIGLFFPMFEVRDIDAGHWLISEKPSEFVDIVVDWIEYKEDL